MSELFHPTADVQSHQIGENTRVWQYAIVLAGAKIGRDCNICSGVFVEKEVRIGDRVTVKSGVQVWDGTILEDDVFIGPNATLTNDRFPPSENWPQHLEGIRVERGATVGANATILPGTIIGQNALVGAGAVVTRDVPPKAIVVGNPAKIVGYTDTPRHVEPALTMNQESVAPGVKNVRWIDLKGISNIRGETTVAELEQDLPFEVKRIFWVYDVPNDRVRGEHVHRELQEVLVCVQGSVAVIADDGETREEYLLDNPSRGLYLPPRVWRTLYKYSADAVLLVLASHPYDPDDYIRDYEAFLSMVNPD